MVVQHLSTDDKKWTLTVVAPTFYSNLDEARFVLGLEACREAARCCIHVILVDGSPIDEVRHRLIESGKAEDGIEWVKVVPQTSKGKKGAALREAIAAAELERQTLEIPEETFVIAFQELEKIDMLRHWKDLVDFMTKSNSDICVPYRSDESFKTSYPIEQYHSEKFANFYLDALGSEVTFPSIDWTMGPLALRAKVSKYWLEFDGELWDAQLVPMVHAQRWHGAHVTSFDVEYKHPELQKQDEEGSPKWSEKRLWQLNVLFDKVGGALKATTPPT
jgi:hypothetical protein